MFERWLLDMLGAIAFAVVLVLCSVAVRECAAGGFFDQFETAIYTGIWDPIYWGPNGQSSAHYVFGGFFEVYW